MMVSAALGKSRSKQLSSTFRITCRINFPHQLCAIMQDCWKEDGVSFFAQKDTSSTPPPSMPDSTNPDSTARGVFGVGFRV
jgi:hypothetical protein